MKRSSLPSALKLALEYDERIQNSEGASFDTHLGQYLRQLLDSVATGPAAVPAPSVAKQNGSMERDYWFTVSRSFDRLEEPEAVDEWRSGRCVVWAPESADTKCAHVLAASGKVSGR
ncbi:MAG: hypothetical protein WKF37_25425 [Bryobacteraceae bacterium]